MGVEYTLFRTVLEKIIIIWIQSQQTHILFDYTGKFFIYLQVRNLTFLYLETSTLNPAER